MPSSEPPGHVATTLEAPALPECLDDVHALVDSLWSSCPGVDATDRMRFESAVVEVAGNVIEHSVAAVGDRVVRLEVTLTCSQVELRATFVDDAEAVRAERLPTAMPDVDAESGRGIALARAFTDDLTYEREGERNRWSVVCRRG